MMSTKKEAIKKIEPLLIAAQYALTKIKSNPQDAEKWWDDAIQKIKAAEKVISNDAKKPAKTKTEKNSDKKSDTKKAKK